MLFDRLLHRDHAEQMDITVSAPQAANVVDAERIAGIVVDGLNSGDYSGIAQKIEECTPTTTSEQYVFPADAKSFHIFFAGLALLMVIPFVYMLGVCIGFLVYSDEYDSFGFLGCFASLVLIFGNTAVSIYHLSSCKFISRYSRYYNVLRFRSMMLVEDVAIYTGITYPKVLGDLHSSIKLGLIPQGHFGKDNLFIILSDTAYHDYEQKKALYDRFFDKLSAERKRMTERTPEMAEIMRQGQQYIDKIHDSNDLIKDKGISEKLQHMENLVSTIFHEVDVNPEQSGRLGLLLGYYLPTTEKLLEAYIELDEKQYKGKSLAMAQMNIGQSLDALNKSFSALLEQFYKDQEVDIASEISALEIMLKQDNLI